MKIAAFALALLASCQADLPPAEQALAKLSAGDPRGALSAVQNHLKSRAELQQSTIDELIMVEALALSVTEQHHASLAVLHREYEDRRLVRAYSRLSTELFEHGAYSQARLVLEAALATWPEHEEQIQPMLVSVERAEAGDPLLGDLNLQPIYCDFD